MSITGTHGLNPALNNQHARDENLSIAHFISGTEAILSLLSTPYL